MKKDGGNWSYCIRGWLHVWKWGFGFGEGGSSVELQVNHPMFILIFRWWPLFSFELNKWWKFKSEQQT